MAELKRSLGYWSVLSLSIGSIIGTAIFFGASIGAKHSGNLMIPAWILLSILSIYIAMCFGELAGMFPMSGGIYEYSKQAYGRFLSFMTGWAAWLVGNIATVVLIVAAINLIMPHSATWVKMGVCIAAIIILNIMALLGTETTSLMTIGFAAAIVGVILAIAIKGATLISPANLTPLATHRYETVFVTMFFLIETYFGWEAATYLSEETKDARKTIPRAIITGTVIVALLGLGMIVVSLGVFGWEKLAGMSTPTASLAEQLFGGTGKQIAIIGVFVALIGSAASGIVTMPRLLLAMARDKLMLEQMQAIHPRFSTPHKAILFQAIITILILGMGFGNYQILLSILVPLAIIMYIPTILSVTILRHTKPQAERAYKAPLGKQAPIILAALLVITALVWAGSTENGYPLLRLSASIILIGLPLYFLVELYYDPKMITEVNDLLSYFSLMAEKLSYTHGIRNEILGFLGNLKGKTVLEFGCGVGSLTVMLIREVGENGKIYATHFSRNDLKIANKRIEQEKWDTEGQTAEVKLIHDPEQFYRLHPEIPRVDASVSVGMLGYLQDTRRILKEINEVMEQGGKLCFVEYTDFFHIIPSVDWLSEDRKIEEIFREAGFSVSVIRKKSLLWNRVIIYGAKHQGIRMI